MPLFGVTTACESGERAKVNSGGGGALRNGEMSLTPGSSQYHCSRCSIAVASGASKLSSKPSKSSDRCSSLSE